MKTLKNLNKQDWAKYTKRPSIDSSILNEQVKRILNSVENDGDEALFSFAKEFDNVELINIAVSPSEIERGSNEVKQELKEAIVLAKSNIEKFHTAQKSEKIIVETTPGVECWRESKAIEKIGLYIPGGSAPLFSTILMLSIPAKIAGCKEIVLCTPPNKSGKVNSAILYTAKLCGINQIYKVGGAQAIGAMTYGTESIPQVYKIFGPGNQFVTKAKELVQMEGVAIDMPAGPSEVLIIADETSQVDFVAADLLSQAEHGEDSQVILLSNDSSIIEKVICSLERQLDQLPRKGIAKEALKNSAAILLNSVDECLNFSNKYAPEHLILASEKADKWIKYIENAGSVFIGNYSCESAGDYASGTNHTLPTNGYAKNYSGVSLDSFVKKITFQKLSKEGINNIGPAIEIMAEAEELFAHKNAVTLRLKEEKNV